MQFNELGSTYTVFFFSTSFDEDLSLSLVPKNQADELENRINILNLSHEASNTQDVSIVNDLTENK